MKTGTYILFDGLTNAGCQVTCLFVAPTILEACIVFLFPCLKILVQQLFYATSSLLITPTSEQSDYQNHFSVI